MIPLVVSYGAGTNSTAMIVGFSQKGIKPDLILFADTGGEKPETYEYIKKFSLFIASAGFPDLVIVKNDGMYGSLEENCLANEMVPSAAYGFRSCSDKYKIRPQNKYCNNWGPARECWNQGSKVRKAIGYDAGPRDRKRARIADDDKYVYEYPLINWGWTRTECEEAILDSGLPLPGKSACFFCPASKKQEVIDLAKNHPDLMKRALEMEDNALPNLHTIKGLGRHWSWRGLVESNKEEIEKMPEAPPLNCVCFDGNE